MGRKLVYVLQAFVASLAYLVLTEAFRKTARWGSGDSFHRQYLTYQHAYAIVETLVPKLRHGIIKNSSSPSQKAYQTNVLDPLFQAARLCITICLSKWTLYHALPYMPRHTLVQISYVALLALQLAYVSFWHRKHPGCSS